MSPVVESSPANFRGRRFGLWTKQVLLADLDDHHHRVCVRCCRESVIALMVLVVSPRHLLVQYSVLNRFCQPKTFFQHNSQDIAKLTIDY